MLVALLAVLLASSDPTDSLRIEWTDCLVDGTEERAHDLAADDDAIIDEAFVSCVRWERSLRTIVALYYDADPDEQMRVWRKGIRPHLLILVGQIKEAEVLVRRRGE